MNQCKQQFDTIPPASMPRSLFVLSTGRVGTGSLARLLALSPRILAVHEPLPMPLPETRAGFGRDAQCAAKPLAAFFTARLNDLRRTEKHCVYAETAHRVGYLARSLAEALPAAQFVHLHRHPGEFIRSAMRRGWYHSNSVDPWRIVPESGDQAFTEWPRMTPFEKLCWHWAAVNRFAADFTRAECRRSITLTFDELYGGGAGDIRLFQFLDVPLPSAQHRTESLGKRINAQRTGDFPPFDHWPLGLRETLRRLAGDVMERLGYEV